MPRPAAEEPYIKDFLDMVAPSVIDFKVDHYLCGNTCRCVWALREYPTSTDEQAILRHLGEMDGVTTVSYTHLPAAGLIRKIGIGGRNTWRVLFTGWMVLWPWKAVRWSWLIHRRRLFRN